MAVLITKSTISVIAMGHAVVERGFVDCIRCSMYRVDLFDELMDRLYFFVVILCSLAALQPRSLTCTRSRSRSRSRSLACSLFFSLL
jgi:hypothetical protein